MELRSYLSFAREVVASLTLSPAIAPYGAFTNNNSTARDPTFKLLKQSQVVKLRICGKGIQCHSNHSPQLFELKQKQQNQVTLFNNFFVIFLIVVILNLVSKYSENETSDEEGKGIFACAGQQHLDTVELATLSSGVEVQPSSTTGANLDVSGKCRVSKIDVVAI